jgi:glycine oxidase
MSGDAIIVGGGLIGLASAWRAAQAGCAVTVVDTAPGGGASNVAAGMLAPVTEVAYGEEASLRLNIASARRWPDFAAELEAVAGETVGYRSDGTLLVGFDADDARVLDDLAAFQAELGLDVRRLRSRACRDREPLLSPRVRGGLLAAGDHRVEPRRVVAALLRALETSGVEMVADRVVAIEHTDGRVTGVRLGEGRRLTAPRIVVAAGSWSGRIEGLPPGAVPPVRPVKGQVLVLRGRAGEPSLAGSVRGLVQGRSIYLVPRGEGSVVVGASQEERGFDTTVTAGATRELLDDAARIVPGVDELELVEAIAGLRPGTPDNRPLVGPGELDGLVLATGHHRSGVLLTPLTAEAVAAWLTDTEPDPVVAVADPRRAGLGRGAAA